MNVDQLLYLNDLLPGLGVLIVDLQNAVGKRLDARLFNVARCLFYRSRLVELTPYRRFHEVENLNDLDHPSRRFRPGESRSEINEAVPVHPVGRLRSSIRIDDGDLRKIAEKVFIAAIKSAYFAQNVIVALPEFLCDLLRGDEYLSVLLNQRDIGCDDQCSVFPLSHPTPCLSTCAFSSNTRFFRSWNVSPGLGTTPHNFASATIPGSDANQRPRF